MEKLTHSPEEPSDLEIMFNVEDYEQIFINIFSVLIDWNEINNYIQ